MSIRFFLVAFFASLLCAFAAPLEIENRSSHSGRGTWFTPGLGNCGKHNKSTDMIVALPTKDYAGGSHCEKMIHITSGGKTHSAKVVDRCPDCSEGDLDMSESLFKEFASLGKGEIKVSWYFQ
ncbi:hypothetical protein FIBSPDRAFT_853390 [Athelia psychrophila]|uniref:RlpA-like protein double-psi beta-barrel domain-containing protein n=1 Tax=Athelia psychrophila TaxID=1759441 RepID=A0A166QTX3_9AGAM|nr:hypothetical protein FIBSPDRAFT_853390 [Fibularhizoctonia sp. CBS 109695]